MVGMDILYNLLISFKFKSLIAVLTLKLKMLFYKVLYNKNISEKTKQDVYRVAN